MCGYDKNSMLAKGLSTLSGKESSPSKLSGSADDHKEMTLPHFPSIKRGSDPTISEMHIEQINVRRPSLDTSQNKIDLNEMLQQVSVNKEDKTSKQ